MTETFNPAQTRWIRLSLKIVSLLKEKSFEQAKEEIDTFLARETLPELRSDALGYRADISEREGNMSDAVEELLRARTLVGPTYLRYVHELRLGDIFRKEQRFREAAEWYTAAIRTSIEGSRISAGNAMNSLLELHDAGLVNDFNPTLYSQAARNSWAVLELPGEPELSDLPTVVAAIKSAESNPPRRA